MGMSDGEKFFYKVISKFGKITENDKLLKCKKKDNIVILIFYEWYNKNATEGRRIL